MRSSPRSSPRALVLAAVIACPALLTGCPAMSTPDRPPAPVDAGAQWEWPLRFTKHSIGVFCFDTYGCRARYGNAWQIQDDPEYRRPASGSIHPDYRRMLKAGHVGLRNFPEPMELSWRSADGTAHEARLDIGRIFRDELVRHNVARKDIMVDTTALGADQMSPEIVVEVNDRTVRVYMRAYIPLKREQIPGNRYSNFADDLVLVETKNF